MKAIVISAGYATRLYPLTLDQPKALLPIKGKPIIEYVLENVDKVKKIDKIFLISNNKFYTNFSWWLSNNQKNLKNP
jgi:glucose-1-phosphate thymidylyltransferase